MSEEDYINRFAEALASESGGPRHRRHDQFARAHYRSVTCDPEGDAVQWRASLETDPDPIKTLTERYHDELRDLLRSELREEIRNSI